MLVRALVLAVANLANVLLINVHCTKVTLKMGR
jgi:hypothetical protein